MTVHERWKNGRLKKGLTERMGELTADFDWRLKFEQDGLRYENLSRAVAELSDLGFRELHGAPGLGAAHF